jgi:mannose-6-phosphate isomerase-like protein (cupin superfamily)
MNKDPLFESKPWGTYKVLDQTPLIDETDSPYSNFKIKKLVVLPKKRLSYQKHNERSEHWTVVKGNAKVLLDGETFFLNEGESIYIPRFSAHRLENESETKKLVIIEVQYGICLESDIERLEDDWGRT